MDAVIFISHGVGNASNPCGMFRNMVRVAWTLIFGGKSANMLHISIMLFAVGNDRL